MYMHILVKRTFGVRRHQSIAIDAKTYTITTRLALASQEKEQGLVLAGDIYLRAVAELTCSVFGIYWFEYESLACRRYTVRVC